MSAKNRGTFTGLDLLEKLWPTDLRGARVGLVMHPASVNRRLEYAVTVCLKSKKFKLTTLFGPQHGILGQTQDNMIEWEGFRDPVTGLPVYSLYGKTRKPLPGMLANIDVLIVDLQDVGSRYYTFIWTLELCMQACHEAGKTVVILDRPNPVGGHITEGPVLKPEFASFVGLRPLPVRHGMTIGEIGLYVGDTFHPGLDYRVIPMQGWKRKMWFDETGLPWVLPSPNMPTLDTALVYPGMC
ncbi:MAG: exo-beta-N-acetylmuramidase NamZ domain-containing protein, partial [Nitrospirota bacterium]